MINRKLFVGVVMALALVVSQVSFASAAPLSGGGGTSCTIASVTVDGSGNYVVTCSNNGDTITLTQAEALAANLIVYNPITLMYDPIWTVGEVVVFTAGVVTTDPCFVTGGTGGSGGSGGSSNPVPGALADFFCGSSASGATMLEELHMEGYGFGEIAQALFMAQILGVSAQQILMDKTNHDFSGLTLPGGGTANNWGQLMKLVLADSVKSMTNLGAIMSGRATPSATSTSATLAPLAPSGNGNTHGNSGNGHGGGNGHGQGNGGNGHP